MGGKKAIEKSREWEKERREKLNNRFDELCKLLPDHDPTVNLSKMEILRKAAEYIRQLQEQNDEIIKCGNTNGLKNETDRLKKRVAHLLLKTKELVNALRGAGVPIPTDKKKKKPSPKTAKISKGSDCNKEDVQKKKDSPSKKKVKCGCEKRQNNNKKKPLSEINSVVTSVAPVTDRAHIAPIIANSTQITSTSQNILNPIVATGIRPLGIDKKVLSQLGPGTLILADGRVVNVPPVVPQLVVKTQPTTVLLMQGNQLGNIKKKEKLLIPKKKDITKITFANKAPIPAIKAFRLESPRVHKPKTKEPKTANKTKEQEIIVTSVSTSTTSSVVTVSTSSPVISTSETLLPLIPEQQEKEVTENNQQSEPRVLENVKPEENPSLSSHFDKTTNQNDTNMQTQQNSQGSDNEKDERSQSIVKYTIDALFSTNKQTEKNQNECEATSDTLCNNTENNSDANSEAIQHQKFMCQEKTVENISVESSTTQPSIVQSSTSQSNLIHTTSETVLQSVDFPELGNNDKDKTDNTTNQNSDQSAIIPPVISNLRENQPSVPCSEIFFTSGTEIQTVVTISNSNNSNSNNNNNNNNNNQNTLDISNSLMESCRETFINKEIQQNFSETKDMKNIDSQMDKKIIENKLFYHNSNNHIPLTEEPNSNQISSIFSVTENLPKTLVFSNNNENNSINNYNFPNNLQLNMSMNSSEIRNDIFSHDITSNQKELSNQFDHNSYSNVQLNLHNTNIPQSIKNRMPLTNNSNSVFSHSSAPISQYTLTTSHNQNIVNRNIFPQTIPAVNKKLSLQTPHSFSQSLSSEHVNNSTQTLHTNQIFSTDTTTSCQSNENHTRVTSSSSHTSHSNCVNFSMSSVTSTSHTSQSNCTNFSMSNLTTKSNNINTIRNEKMYNHNQMNILNESNSGMIDHNQNTSKKTAPVCVLTNNKNIHCQDKNDKLYSTNTEGNSFKTDAVCTNDFLHSSKDIDRNPFIPPIEDVRLSSDFSNDLFSSLQVPTGAQHSESISPTAAFLLAFPLVSTSKNSDNMNEAESHENQTSTPTTILQIGNIDAPNTELFQPIEFSGKNKDFDMNGDYITEVHMKCKRKEVPEKKMKGPPVYQHSYNYTNPTNEYNNQYDLWSEANNKGKQVERKKLEKLPKTYNYEYYKQDRKKKSKISVSWMTTPEADVYPRENETSFLTSNTLYNVEIDNIPDLYTSKKTAYSWSPTKSFLPLDSSLIVPTSTLPTLVGDLALGTSTPSDMYKRQEKKLIEKPEEKRLPPKSQVNFLSVSQLVDPKSKKLKPPDRNFKKHEKKRTTTTFPKRKDSQDPCMFTDNLPNFNWDKQRYKGNYSAESLIGTQEINDSFNYQQNNYFPNSDFSHETNGQGGQYQNCFNFSQTHFSSYVPDEFQADNFGINNVSSRSLQNADKIRSEPRCREESFQTGFLQGHYHSHPCSTTASVLPPQSNFNLPCPTTSSSLPPQGNFNLPGMSLSNYSITTNAPTTLTNFNLSTIFPEMNDQRSAPTGQGTHMHMNTFAPSQNYRSHPPI